MASIEGVNPGYYGRVNWFLDATDDPLLADAVPSFEGGQFSNLRANLLAQNQSKSMINCDIDKLGKVRTRRGTIRLGSGTPSGTPNTIIQGLTSYQTAADNYVVAANNRKIWQWNEGTTTWTQIATGGVADNDDIRIYRLGAINNAAGYSVGDTVLTVDGFVGIVDVGEKLYFSNNLRTDWWEYTIAAHTETAGNTTQITLEEPGLVFPVKDNWKIIVARPAQINNAAGYPAGYTGAMTIDGYTGTVNLGEYFVVKSENKRHLITAASGTPTTSITGSVALQADYIAVDAVSSIVFAQGNDQLFFCDGTGSIYAWNGKTTTNLSALNTLDFLTGSTLTQTQTAPPTGCDILVWFQNRLIASGIAAEPDAIYFSDFFDPTSWDRDYQKLRIGGGESDPITGLVPWMDYNLVVFKKNSIYVISMDPSQNPTPDDPTLLVASYAVKQLHKRIGCPAPQTAVQVGGGSTTPGSDIFFLDGDKQVHSIRRVMAAETQQEIGPAISLPVQDVMDTTNVTYIDRASGMYHNQHYFIGIPSTRGSDGGQRPNMTLVYNMLTQSWCGTWTWWPTCFSMRTDLGQYSKLIFGDNQGFVRQWLDDLSLDQETATTYQDYGNPLGTTIVTRAITFGDTYSYKTGLNVEVEFDESIADSVYMQVILDKVTHPTLVALPFSSLSAPRLRLPIVIPFVLPDSPTQIWQAFDLQRYGTWRELQFQISTNADKLAIRSIRVTGFIDTIQLQTVPISTVSHTEFVVTGMPADPEETVTGDDTLPVTVGP